MIIVDTVVFVGYLILAHKNFELGNLLLGFMFALCSIFYAFKINVEFDRLENKKETK